VPWLLPTAVAWRCVLRPLLCLRLA